MLAAQGGTVRLPAVFRDASNALVDPSNPLVDILDPSDLVVVNDAVPTRESVGNYYYDYAIPVGAVLGDWSGRFTGGINGFTVQGTETFSVVSPGSVNAAQGDLITRMRLLDAMNRLEADMEPQEIRKFDSAITAASAAVRAYAARDFTLATSASPVARTFEYDPSGYLDIDDAQSVIGVRILSSVPQVTPVVLDTYQWRLMPFNKTVKNVVILNTDGQYGVSRAMGFTYNLDTYEGPAFTAAPLVEVTAIWGWPEIPEDVQQATIWAAAAFTEEARSVTSESIESFSRSMDRLAPTALPLRSRDLLDEYRRITV